MTGTSISGMENFLDFTLFSVLVFLLGIVLFFIIIKNHKYVSL